MSDHLAHSVELAKRTWAPFLALLAINYHHAQNTDSSHNYIADRTLIPKTYAECQGAQILAAVDAFDFFRTSGPRHPIARDADGAVRGIEQQVEVDTEIVRAIRELTTPIRK